MKKLKRFVLITFSSVIVIAGLAIASFKIFNTATIIDTNYPVGFADGSYTDTGRGRQLAWYAWYPTRQNSPVSLVEENVVFRGTPSIQNASIDSASMPLVILSHGSGGNRGNQAWLAVELARHGALVVALNHPGSTSRDSAPTTNILTWERPKDIQYLIDRLLNDPAWSQHIDRNRISIVGHSLGGYTALAVGGMRIEMRLFQDYCQKWPQKPDCRFYRNGGVNFNAVDRAAFESEYSDTHISAIVSIDPAFTFAANPESLAGLPPTLLLAAHHEIGSEFDLQVARLAQISPSQAVYTEVEGAHHFSFLPLCKPFGYYILDIVEETAELLCALEVGRTRQDVHNEVAEEIVKFMEDAGVL